MILYLVKSDKNYGIGHLKRALSIIKLTEKIIKLAILTDPDYKRGIVPMIEGVFSQIIDKRYERELLKILDKFPVELVILDIREAEKRLLRLFIKRNIPIISFDDFGYGRETSEVLINPLPHFKPKYANFEDMIYNPLDVAEEREKDEVIALSDKNKKNIMISFGGSDPKNIARKVVKALDNPDIRNDFNITLIVGPLARYTWLADYKHIGIVHSPATLSPYIEKSDIVFTSIGMTMQEALFSGKKVIAINPTGYHNKIAKTIPGIINLGGGGFLTKKRIQRALDKPNPDHFEKYLSFDYRNWFFSLTKQLSQNHNAQCPVCGRIRRQPLHRCEDYTLFRCLDCHSNYKYLLKSIDKPYDEDYFVSNHQKAYGKNYIEDESNIRSYARRRLNNIKKFLRLRPTPSLLDVGSALGIFCDEAQKKGFISKGAEISDYARDYSRKKYNIFSYQNFEAVTEKFDVISMWFVLEHLPNPLEWIEKAYELLNPNGVLALSVPNGDGLFARNNKKGYVLARPVEHIFEPSSQALKKILKKCGFKIKRVEYFGLHPSRIGLPNWGLLKAIQKAWQLGDTYEIYAVKRHP